MFGDEDWTDSG